MKRYFGIFNIIVMVITAAAIYLLIHRQGGTLDDFTQPAPYDRFWGNAVEFIWIFIMLYVFFFLILLGVCIAKALGGGIIRYFIWFFVSLALGYLIDQGFFYDSNLPVANTIIYLMGERNFKENAQFITSYNGVVAIALTGLGIVLGFLILSIVMIVKGGDKAAECM